MAVKSGVGSQLGVAVESTYGTFVAPATFYPFTSESLSRENEYIRTAGLRANQLTQSEDLHVQTTHSAGGSVNLDFLTKGMGKWLTQLHGNAATPVQQAATIAYLQTHAIGRTTPDGKMLSIQVGRPDTGGTTRAFSYVGSKVTAASFSCERGGVLTSEWTIDSKDASTAETLGTATYTADAIPFNFTQGSIELDDVVLTDCVRSASVNIEIPYDTDRYCIGSGSTKSQPIQNGLISVTGELECEFASLVQYAAFTAATRRKLELIFTGAVIVGAENYLLTFTMPSTVTVSAGPTVEGPDVLTQQMTFEALDAAAEALTITYKTTDTAL